MFTVTEDGRFFVPSSHVVISASRRTSHRSRTERHGAGPIHAILTRPFPSTTLGLLQAGIASEPLLRSFLRSRPWQTA